MPTVQLYPFPFSPPLASPFSFMPLSSLMTVLHKSTKESHFTHVNIFTFFITMHADCFLVCLTSQKKPCRIETPLCAERNNNKEKGEVNDRVYQEIERKPESHMLLINKRLCAPHSCNAKKP